MKKCSSCGKINIDENKFCAKCGKKLPNKYICPGCGKSISPRDPFCKNCGKSLKDKEKEKKKKLSNLKKTFIGLGSFIGFIVIVLSGLFLFKNFYSAKESHLKDDAVQFSEEGETSKSATFGELQVSEEINKETLEPLNVTEEFFKGFKEVYATIFVSGVSLDDSYTYKWKDNYTNEIIIDFTENYFTDEGFIPNLIAITDYKDIKDSKILSEPGEYAIEFYHNGKLIDDITFTVTHPELAFGELVICPQVDDETDAPIGENSQFNIEIRNICATIHVTGAESKDNWRLVFKEAYSRDIIKEFTDKYYPNEKGYFEGYQAICLYVSEEDSIKDIPIFGEPSDYTVEFYHNGEFIDSADFTINPIEIVFSSDHDGTPYSIYSCMPDGSDFKRIYSDGFRDANLCWNKNHSQLVTASTKDGDGDHDLFIIDLANGEISRLTDREGDDLEPNISPDGSLVVFAGTVGSEGNTEIFIVGTSIKQLTYDPHWNSYPHYSPDGKNIIFSSNRSGYCKLYTMDTEGNNVVQITNDGEWHDWDGSFSPDGKKIVFVSDRSGNDEIWVMPLDNPGAAINLTNNPDVDMYPDYSPDGGMIVFESDRDEAVKYMHDIFVMDADGDNQTNITPDLKGSYQVGPSW